MTFFDPQLFRQQFPLLVDNDKSNFEKSDSNTGLIYFDNAATTQKPKQVIDSQQGYYQELNANVHRASHQLSTKATIAFENARALTQKFINAQHINQIIWSKGATESINIITHSLARNTLKQGDEIVLCVSEHHANIVPWQIVAEQTGAIIKVLPINALGYLDVNQLDKVITEKTKFVACAHISNVIGKINPISLIIEKAKSVGAISVIDGAQAVAHVNIDVQALDCDFYVFSAHKMYGPTGVGVLYGKQALLESMSPYQGGGEMIKTVSFINGVTYNTLPFKLEAGTPNIAGVVTFAESIKFLSPLLTSVDNNYALYEKSLIDYCYQALSKIPQVTFIVEGAPDIPVFAFTVVGHHNQDLAIALDAHGIAIRSGHHCAMPLMETLSLRGCLRVSLAAYNTRAEVDYFIDCLQSLINDNHTMDNNIENNIVLLADEPSTDTSAMDNIITLFSKIKGWDGRHREIMLLGKVLPRLDKDLRDETTLITGCESLAWLAVNVSDTGRYTFTADSDAKIIRGLLVIVLAAFNDKTACEIQAININHYFDKLGLMQHLSPSRGNGLLAIVEKVKCLAQ
ncbi:SufS family cysteine desulfurase [Colwellia echini]|uniref:cysteine desulfurase n=1 Tax=Colwellia echini TaxID=1982103 RepID=A0ABY3MUL8_9GAMM|nr:SufS family cysteine desulfurase [Colwellia echini]TYK64903.1 SufS family cysteine desulfurase [Colwellia echini]